MQGGGKIVFSIIAFYLVAGVYNYSSTGIFITPYFLNYIVLSIVACALAILNRKNTDSSVLIVYAIAMLVLTLTNSLSITVLFKWLNIGNGTKVEPIEALKLAGIILFYAALIFNQIKIIRLFPKSVLLKSITLIVLISFIGVLSNHFWVQIIGLSAYFLSFLIIWNYYKPKEYSIFEPLSYQFLLFLFIENIRLLSFG